MVRVKYGLNKCYAVDQPSLGAGFDIRDDKLHIWFTELRGKIRHARARRQYN